MAAFLESLRPWEVYCLIDLPMAGTKIVACAVPIAPVAVGFLARGENQCGLFQEPDHHVFTPSGRIFQIVSEYVGARCGGFWNYFASPPPGKKKNGHAAPFWVRQHWVGVDFEEFGLLSCRVWLLEGKNRPRMNKKKKGAKPSPPTSKALDAVETLKTPPPPEARKQINPKNPYLI